jgi:hypothetical protein
MAGIVSAGKGRKPLFYFTIISLIMNLDIPAHLLAQIITRAAEMGANLALSKTGRIKPYLNKNEAFRLYGRKNVERWIEDGLLTPRKDGDHSASWRIDRLELEVIVKAREMLQSL